MPKPHIRRCLLCSGALSGEDRGVCDTCRACFGVAKIIVRTDYSGSARDLVYATKFTRMRAGAYVMTLALCDLLDEGPYIVTYVPTTIKRRRQRGYDQSELIARCIAQHMNWECRTMLRRGDDSRQLGSSRAQRRLQADSAYTALPIGRDVADRLLLVDDVITTGSSASAAAMQLRDMGHKDIVATIFALAPY